MNPKTEKWWQYRSLIFNVDSYKTYLLNDFSKNKGFADMASAISCRRLPNIDMWVREIEGDWLFDGIRQTGDYKFDIFKGIDMVKNISYTPYYFKEKLEDLYMFFSRRIYNKYEDAKKNFPYYDYYVSDDKLYEIINKKILVI